MRHPLPQPLLDRWFRIGAAFKGADGILEVLGAMLLLFVPLARIQGAIATLCLYEIQEDNHHAFIANFILHADRAFSSHAQVFAAIYLLCHGSIKVLLAFALLKRYYQMYPYAIGFLLAFVAYQAYLVIYNHSIALSILTLFDCTIAWLTYLEWNRHRKSASHT
ncbi:MAG TPA: DUF2127 domain-containing protein [Candidatus Saccharimonadia bacterium]|nr:DUF2127 domain-containing protein [Candidatus Saccharimonadia bacterium]